MDYLFLNNALNDWIYAALTALVVYLAVSIIRRFLLWRLAKQKAQPEPGWHALIGDVIRRIHSLFLLLLALYIGTFRLTFSDLISDTIRKIFVIVLLLQTGRLLSAFIRQWIALYRDKKAHVDASVVTTMNTVGFLVRIVLWVILFLIALDNFGVNVTTLIAGLGIGGIAVALAVQNVLSDLFASFSIVLDKPFVIGDFIIVDDLMGTVEYIGIKTTRIRSLSGEQLVFANADLLNSRIRNFKHMVERRVVFTIGVQYQTPLEKIETIPAMIRDIIENKEAVRFDRAHFKEYGAYSLVFEIVYWIKNPDYNYYMDTQQAINLEIFKHFKATGIEFAYPTQTLYMLDGANTPAGE